MQQTVKLGSRGPQVRKLQKEINKTLSRAKLGWMRVEPDGVAGKHTFKAARFAGGWQGLSPEMLKRIGNAERITPHVYEILTHSKPRSAAMDKRARDRRERFVKLRIAHDRPPVVDGLATFDDSIQRNSPAGPVKVAAWMVGAAVGPDGRRVNWLAKARKHGWDGYLTSGFRDPAYSEALCIAMCGAPSCPGRCAGRSSNHSGKNGGPIEGTGTSSWGAIDATDYDNLERIFAEIGAPLRNALGASDPVHFSSTGV